MRDGLAHPLLFRAVRPKPSYVEAIGINFDEPDAAQAHMVARNGACDVTPADELREERLGVAGMAQVGRRCELQGILACLAPAGGGVT